MSADFQPVPTRAALALQRKQNTQPEFKAYVFDQPKELLQTTIPKQKLKGHDSDEEITRRITTPIESNMEGPEFDIKRARNEVLNFAIANQRLVKNKRKMEIFKAIKLGAKPPKKAYKNYKDLQAERKRLKEIREERWKYHQLGKSQTGAASVKCRNKAKEERKQKKRAPVTNIDRNYGVAKPNFKKKK